MRQAVAIVGMGPRGLYAFERLAAQLRFLPPRRPVEIHLVNRTPFFGPGENFRPDQPEHSMLNFAISHVDVWPRQTPRPAPATRHDLESWLREEGAPERDWGPASTVSRALVGRYLDYCFEAIVDALPEGARVVRHQAEATALERDGDRFRLELRELEDVGGWEDAAPVAGARRWLDVVFDHVLLATGHTPEEESDAVAHARRFAEEHDDVHHVAVPLPIGRWLDDVPAGETVAVRGMGLTFVDVAVALTEGRGGRFVERPGDVAPRYEPSGDEPATIVPFSRSGRLPSPKPRGPWPRRDRYVPKFFTREAVERARAAAGGTLDFERDLWPLLEREMAYEYYHAGALEEERPLLVATAGDADAFDRLRAGCEERWPDLPPFELERLLDPRRETDYASPETHHAFTVERLAWELEEARRGREHSPFQAALEVWNKVFPTITAAVELRGLVAESHRVFDAERKRPMARATYGPPIVNAAKILALARAGLIDFGLAPEGEVEFDDDDGAYRVVSGRVPGARVARWLIEARMPGNDLERDATPLLRRLLRDGLIRPHVNDTGPGEPYAPGGLDLVPGTATVVGRDGRPIPGLAATGWMTEGPLVGNDALFREVNDMSGPWAAHVVADLRRRE